MHVKPLNNVRARMLEPFWALFPPAWVLAHWSLVAGFSLGTCQSCLVYRRQRCSIDVSTGAVDVNTHVLWRNHRKPVPLRTQCTVLGSFSAASARIQAYSCAIVAGRLAFEENCWLFFLPLHLALCLVCPFSVCLKCDGRKVLCLSALENWLMYLCNSVYFPSLEVICMRVWMQYRSFYTYFLGVCVILCTGAWWISKLLRSTQLAHVLQSAVLADCIVCLLLISWGLWGGDLWCWAMKERKG